jgi:hypothetical protein
MSTNEEHRGNRVRTSDAERERVAETLREAVTEGRLTLEEGDERLATLYKTKFRDELPPLLADLPASGDDWSAEHDNGRGESGRTEPGDGWGPRGAQERRDGWGPRDGWGGGHRHGWDGPGRGGPGGGGYPGGPFGPWGRGLGGFDERLLRRWQVLGFAKFALVIAALVLFAVFTGHFFWPIIPILLFVGMIRMARFRCGWAHAQRSAGERRGGERTGRGA